MAGKAYVLILNWNNWNDTVACLESVFQNAYPNYQVVVIDNASTDDSEERISEWANAKSIIFKKYVKGLSGKDTNLENPSILFIQTGINLGYAGGNNVGLRYVLKMIDCAYIWILNNDTIVHRDALSEMVKMADEDERTGMVGSKLLFYDKPGILQAAGGCRIVPWMGNASIIATNEKDDGSWDEPFEVSSLSGASLLVKKAVADEVGLMDERFFLYWEDVDWGERARRKGYRNMYCPQSRVMHKEGGTSGTLNFKTDYYWVRNGLYFTSKHYPHLLLLVLFSYLAKYTLVRVFKNQPLNLKAYFKGVLDFLSGKTGAI